MTDARTETGPNEEEEEEEEEEKEEEGTYGSKGDVESGSGVCEYIL